MEWIHGLQRAIEYIEAHLTEPISPDDIARAAFASSAHFQRVFAVVTGMPVGEYIRNRRLTLAGQQLVERRAKVLSVALACGYETPESFAKAFQRFHGCAPSAAWQAPGSLRVFAPLRIEVQITGGFGMTRRLIPNVPVIQYDGNNAGIYATLLSAALESIGEECDRGKLTVLSGAGNRFCWKDGEWVFGNEMPEAINETPFETESRVLRAIGWKATYITVQRDGSGQYMNTDPERIRRDFMESIDKGYPVIARYAEHADCNANLFFGYEDGGQKVISYPFNNGFEPGVSAPTDFETPVAEGNWERNIAGYILLQGREEAASERNAALSAFDWISRHARRTTEIRGKRVGFAAWESYLRHLERDDFSELSFEDVKARFFIYCDGLCQIYERNQALDYYRSLAERFPEWRDELETAIPRLKDCAKYGGYLWEHGFTFDDNGFEKFRSPEARKMLADAGREALRHDMEAVEQFEAILRKEREGSEGKTNA